MGSDADREEKTHRDKTAFLREKRKITAASVFKTKGL